MKYGTESRSPVTINHLTTIVSPSTLEKLISLVTWGQLPAVANNNMSRKS